MDITGILLVKLLLGGAITLLFTRALRIAFSTYAWEKTIGAVGVSSIDELRGKVRVKGKQLAYIYQVEDQEFVSNRIYAPIPDNLFVYIIYFNDIKFIQKNYTHGQSVNVFFNPKNPKQACLKQGGTKYVLIEFSIWLAFFSMIVVLW